jgi:hypothetical protein
VNQIGLTTDAGSLRADGIRETSDLILRNQTKASTWLTQADKYMQAYAENPTAFILPKAHAFMKPLIEAYAYNLDGFTEYVLGIRDSFERQSSAWTSVHSLYRRLLGRHTQQLRRERSNRAIAKAEELHGKVGFHDRLRWVARLEHDWAQRRLAFMDKCRAKAGVERLNTEDRSELLLEFWETIDMEIYEGKVPPWN